MDHMINFVMDERWQTHDRSFW